MRKADLCQHMAEHMRRRCGKPFSRLHAAAFLEELHRVAVLELTTGGRFRISKVATFEIEDRRARKVRHPTTGQPMTIPARRVLRARPSSVLRRTVEEE